MARMIRVYLIGIAIAGSLALAAPRLAAQEIIDAGLGQALQVTDSARMGELVTQLELTPSQETRLREMSEAFEQRNKTALEQAQRMMTELQELQAKGDMDADALIELSQKYAETVTALLPATQQFLKDVMAILTPQQQEKFRRMMGGSVPRR